MKSRGLYNHPPITEAVLDLRVGIISNAPQNAWTLIQPHVADEYPDAIPTLAQQLQIQPGPAFQFSVSQGSPGAVFHTRDRTRAFQVSESGFTANRLRPYDSWFAFKAEAQRLWAIYCAIYKPLTITRAALRYINRIEIPSPVDDLQTYLRTVPEVAGDFPHALTGFFMQLQMKQSDLDALLVVNETLAPQTEPTRLPVVFDIDVAREHVWPVDSVEVWDFLDKLRDRKNEVFEASITDDARKLFQ